jgi:hypothetical protein
MVSVSRSRRPLDWLRRSTRLAAFALAVFVLRVGIVAACAPSDLAELVQSGGMADVVQADSDHDIDAVDPGHVKGHCLHCSCHHAVTLPASHAPVPPLAITFAPAAPITPQATAPPDMSLRPPIR